MWQRIQTLYLFIAICLNLVIYLLDLAQIKTGELFSNFNLYGLTDAATGTEIYSTLVLSLLCTLSTLVSLVIIFMFKQRQLQIKLAQLNLFLQTAFVAAVFFIIEGAAAEITTSGEPVVEYEAGAFLSVVPIVFLFLAVKATKKDEALVRAADRIR